MMVLWSSLKIPNSVRTACQCVNVKEARRSQTGRRSLCKIAVVFFISKELFEFKFSVRFVYGGPKIGK